MPTFVPLDDQILVRRDIGETAQGKLHIPDRAVERPLIGEVLAVGPGRRLPSGERQPCQLRPGERVVFRKYAGTDVAFDGAECMVLREADVLGILEEEFVTADGGPWPEGEPAPPVVDLDTVDWSKATVTER